MSRRPKLEITLDDDGAPYSATIYLPIDPSDQPEPKFGERRPATIIPEVTVLPWGDHTEIIFNIQADFIVKRKPEPLTVVEQFLFGDLSIFWELAETLLPENERSKSWLPVYLRDQNSYDFDIVAAKDFYGRPEGVSPFDLPKLYSYWGEDEAQDVGVVKNTVHLPKSWVATQTTHLILGPPFAHAEAGA